MLEFESGTDIDEAVNDVESAALWKLYSENKYETIAIQSTFEKLDSETKNL